jgi:hypothetical protein
MVNDWLAPLLHICKVLVSKIRPGDQLSLQIFSWFSLIVPGTGSKVLQHQVMVCHFPKKEKQQFESITHTCILPH